MHTQEQRTKAVMLFIETGTQARARYTSKSSLLETLRADGGPFRGTVGGVGASIGKVVEMNNAKRRAVVAVLVASLVCGVIVAAPAFAPSGSTALPQAHAASYKSYVGTYVRKEKAGVATELGPAGTVQTVRTVKVAKIAKGKVKFKVTTRYPLQKKTSKTGWITAKIKAGKAAFSYKASRGERGKGTIALKSGKLRLKLKATKWAGYPSDTFKALAFGKGTHVYSA